MRDWAYDVFVVGLTVLAGGLLAATLSTLPTQLLLPLAVGTLCVLTALAVAFPVLWMIRSRGAWRHGRVGRVMMTQGVVVALLLLLTLLNVVRPFPLETQLALAAVLYSALSVVKLGLIRTVLRTSFARSREKTPDQELRAGVSQPF